MELISLSTDIQPIRFIYPAPILPNPSLLWDGEGLHLIAATKIGSLFRIVVPIYEGAPLWQVSTLGDIIIREHPVARMRGGLIPALVHVQGLHCVVASLPDGSLLRLEAEKYSDDAGDGTLDLTSSCGAKANTAAHRRMAGDGSLSSFVSRIYRIILAFFVPRRVRSCVYRLPSSTHRYRSYLDDVARPHFAVMDDYG